ncbi:aminotransferase class I/II-fold pyridoxal phosphate-dependent enzyme [Lachnospiraceae bacterium 48-21]
MLKVDIVNEWEDIIESDVEKVADYLRNNPVSYIDGAVIKTFENNFAKFVGKKYAVAYSSGTAALYAAISTCECLKNKKIVLSEYSYFGAVYAALENNAMVVLCPFETDTLTIDVKKLEEIIDNDTVAVIVTHIWGNPCDMDKLSELRQKYGIKIISDASHAHGAEWREWKIGGLPCEDIACFSLGKGKLITGGELGVAVTDSLDIYNRLLLIGHPNRVPKALVDDKYKKYSNGYGIKLRPHVAALIIGNEQLKRYDEKLKGNRETNAYLEKRIVEIPGFSKIHSSEYASRVYWKLVIVLDKAYWKDWSTEKVVSMLRERGIILEQFHSYDFAYENDILNNDRYTGRLINESNMTPPDNMLFLPTFVRLKRESLEGIIEAFREVSEERERL